MNILRNIPYDRVSLDVFGAPNSVSVPHSLGAHNAVTKTYVLPPHTEPMNKNQDISNSARHERPNNVRGV
ncbi:hypothetical protein OEA41_006998 [Lepraria neglecta]|uniref:Uncharacterized protein n=1 Tax=Lepraria neglecta TaxID=209136 RepID=A0AAE0DL32_9LECA|nr:hypothetical protein OEA41_006998 [Lepraria neglecta]